MEAFEQGREYVHSRAYRNKTSNRWDMVTTREESNGNGNSNNNDDNFKDELNCTCM